MPLLLTEALPSEERERAFAHVESCASCSRSWSQSRETWQILAELPEVAVPARVRHGFLAEVRRMQPTAIPDNVVPFQRRPAARCWCCGSWRE
jgi:hypothetical protein